MKRPNPIRDTDDEARETARALLGTARHAALGTLHENHPMVTRIAFGLTPDFTPVTLISELSAHAQALTADPRASLLIGEPGPKGDPLTHPRLTLQVTAHREPDKSLRDHYLTTHPKAQLYIDFTDFHFIRFAVIAAHLNGGFGKAYHLLPDDLRA